MVSRWRFYSKTLDVVWGYILARTENSTGGMPEKHTGGPVGASEQEPRRDYQIQVLERYNELAAGELGSFRGGTLPPA